MTPLVLQMSIGDDDILLICYFYNIEKRTLFLYNISVDFIEKYKILDLTVYVVAVINVPYMSKYQHSSPRRKDSGTYKIQAVNKYGQDTAELEIIVTCECEAP